MISETLLNEIKQHEAYRSHAYKDSLGVLTIGYGLNLEDGISEPLASEILKFTVQERQDTLSRLLSFWGELTPARQEVFVNMAFNLGVPRFLKFRRMLVAAMQGDVAGVCTEMRNSKWAEQVKSRADFLIEKYRKG